MIVMKNITKYKIYAFCAATLCLFSLSCKRDEIEKNDLVAYVAQNLSAYNEIPTNIADTVISNLSLIYAGKTGLGFPVLLIEASKSGVEITGRIANDPELINAYDSLYHTKSLTIPDGLFKMVGDGKAHIKAGQTQSIDSLKIEINNISGLAMGKHTFVVPIALEATAKNTKLKSKLMFMRYNIVVNQVYASISGLSGGSDIILLNTTNLDPNIFIQASLSNSIRQATEISVVEVDSRMFLDAYNTEHNTSYLPFPKAAYRLLQNTTTIPTNKKVSAQSIQVQLTDPSLLNTTQNYLLALRIKENGILSLADPQKNTVYISIQKNNIDLTNAVLTGQQMDRIGWKVNALGYYEDFVPANILDGKNTTAWDSDGKLPQWLTLDMGMAQTVKGFSLVPNYKYREDDFIEMDVLSSDDGKIWKIEGKYVGTRTSSQSSVNKPDLKTIKFIDPVTARYFKFNITKTTEGQFTGMAELYGIK